MKKYFANFWVFFFKFHLNICRKKCQRNHVSSWVSFVWIVYVSEYHSTILIQYLLSLLEQSLQLQWSSSGCTLKRCIWSESTSLDMETSSWEMAPWLQLIMTSPRAFTHQPEFGSRAVAESALNSASWKMLSGPVGAGGSHMGTSWPQLLKRDKLRNSYSIFPDWTKQTEV